MARLPTAPARLTVPRPALMAPKDEAGRTRYRREVTPWRKWYDTARWKRLRWSVLLRDLFMCQMCKRVEGDTSQLVGGPMPFQTFGCPPYRSPLRSMACLRPSWQCLHRHWMLLASQNRTASPRCGTL